MSEGMCFFIARFKRGNRKTVPGFPEGTRKSSPRRSCLYE